MSQPPVDALRLALGQDHLDRRAELRRSGWDSLPEPRRIVVIDVEGNVGLEPFDSGLRPRPAPRLAAPAAITDIGAGRRAGSGLFLGVDAQGAAVIGHTVQRSDPQLSGLSWASLRTIGMKLSDEDRAVVTELVALSNWHASHRHCPRCGSSTQVAGLGWWRICPQDGSEHYPRTDPAVIALLRDDEDNVLLGRQTVWTSGAFSTLAGFVEPGESAEAAVRREISEEVGLTPERSTYLGSQPWPFPASLMLGFHARISGVRPTPHVDGLEIAEARWLDRDELAAAARAREVRLPGRLSIAHHLISRWFGADMPEEWCRW
jgi:NAD+ diphosphatase